MKRCVLLVDDVELFLELEKTFLHRSEFDLLMAINAKEIIQLVLQHKPDLVFLDMMISGVRGDDICRWIKNDSELRTILVVMLVESGDFDAEARCRQAGSDAILHSPIRRNQLLKVACNLLKLNDRRQARVAKQVLVQYGEECQQLSRQVTVNLSPGEMFLATNDVYPVSTSLDLRIHLPGQEELSCREQVAWLNNPKESKKPHLPTGMGVEFSKLADQHLERVSNFLYQPMI